MNIMKTYKTRSFWINKKNKGVIESGQVSTLGDNEIVIRTKYSGISFGTEKLVFTGKVPKSQRNLMRCPHQEGNFGEKLKYGYINVGKGIDGCSDLINKNVFSFFPHQDVFKIHRENIIIIPDDIPLTRSLLLPNLETAINAVWDTMPSIGDKIIVVGAGVVGLLTAYLLNKIPGTEVVVVDKDKKRKKIVSSLGLNYLDKIPKNFEPNFIFECTGNHNVLNQLKQHIAYETTICILSWYGNEISKISLGEEFFSKRAKIIISQVSRISPNRSKYSMVDRRRIALNILQDNILDNLIEKNQVKFEDLEKFFIKEKNSNNLLCKVVKY